MQFNLSRNIDARRAGRAGRDRRRRCGQLPPDMPTPPSYQKVNPADQPILYLALSSPTLPLSHVDEVRRDLHRAAHLHGRAASRRCRFSARRNTRCACSSIRTRWPHAQIGIDEVSDAIQARQRQPADRHALRAEHSASRFRPTASSRTPPHFGPMIVAYRNGSPVRLDDLGRVIDSVQNDKSASWFNGKRAIVLAIQRQPGTNTVEVVDASSSCCRNCEAQIPAAVQIDTLYDRSVSIRASVDDVKFTLMLTIGLVVMVIFLFLRNISATVIPSLALPMSIIGTFAVMYLLGYSLDNLSLMALTLSVGFVVDDAIVMLENIVRHMEMGKSPMQRGARRLAGNRLHHFLDDALAGRGVHPGAVHGRHHRTAAARIRRHDRRRDSGLRLRLADPHADAVQPLPEATPRAEARALLQRERKGFR